MRKIRIRWDKMKIIKIEKKKLKYLKIKLNLIKK